VDAGSLCLSLAIPGISVESDDQVEGVSGEGVRLVEHPVDDPATASVDGDDRGRVVIEPTRGGLAATPTAEAAAVIVIPEATSAANRAQRRVSRKSS